MYNSKKKHLHMTSVLTVDLGFLDGYHITTVITVPENFNAIEGSLLSAITVNLLVRGRIIKLIGLYDSNSQS